MELVINVTDWHKPIKGHPTTPKRCKCDRPWADHNQRPLSCVRCGRSIEVRPVTG